LEEEIFGSSIEKSFSVVVANTHPSLLNVVINNFTEFVSNINFVEVEVVVFSDFQGGLWVLKIFENLLKISIVGLFVFECSADLSSGVWVVIRDHLDKEPGQFIESFDEVLFTLFHE